MSNWCPILPGCPSTRISSWRPGPCSYCAATKGCPFFFLSFKISAIQQSHAKVLMSFYVPLACFLICGRGSHRDQIGYLPLWGANVFWGGEGAGKQKWSPLMIAFIKKKTRLHFLVVKFFSEKNIFCQHQFPTQYVQYMKIAE